MTDTETNATETQGQTDGSEKLIGGKYKSQEELLASLEQSEREKNNLKESLDREQRLNQLLDDVTTQPKQPSTTSTPATYDEFGDEFDENQKTRIQQILNAREQAIYQRVGSLVETKLSQAELNKKAVEGFYKQYPDLVGFEDMVDLHAVKLKNELGSKASQVSYDKLSKELASRVKDALKETKKKLTKTSLHVEGGEMEEHRENRKREDEGAPSEEQRVANYFKNEVPSFNKKKNMSAL